MSWDDFGGDPAPGNAVDVKLLGDSLGVTADAARNAHDRLKRLDDGVDDAIWRGKSAVAFKESIKEAPEHLAKLHESFASAAEALHGYAGSLGDLQQRACTLLPQLEAAKGDATTAQTSHDSAPPEQQAGAQTAVDQAKSHLGQLTTQVQQIRDDRKTAETTAVGQLQTAHDQGIKNESWWHHALHSLASIAEFIGFVLAVIAIIVVVVVLIMTPGGWVALLAAFEAAGNLFVISSAFALGAVALKATNKATGGEEEAGWGRLAWDGAIAAVGVWGGSLVEGLAEFGRYAKVTSVGSGYLAEASLGLQQVPLLVEGDGIILATVANVPVVRVTLTPVELFTVSTAHAADLSNVLDVGLSLYAVGDYEHNNPGIADPILLGAAAAVPEAAPALSLGVGIGNKVDDVLSSLGID